MSRISDLFDHLVGLAIPVAGISTDANQTPPLGVEISYLASVTQEQIDQANQIRDLWDYRPRRSLTAAQIGQAIASLTNAQQNVILRRFIAFVIRQNRSEAIQALSALSIPIAIDEVDPNPPPV